MSPSDQIDGLFSGCSDILTDDADGWECLKIFIASLKMLQDKVNLNNTCTVLHKIMDDLNTSIIALSQLIGCLEVIFSYSNKLRTNEFNLLFSIFWSNLIT